ncbi:MAG: MFS transporter, partial [Alphaproteobacteria bacterium]
MAETGAAADVDAPHLTPTMTTMQRLRAIVGGSAGNLVEWYDWFAYTSFSLYFASSFFPKGNEELALLQAAITNMISFGARPIGAWIMGNFADRAGRKTALIVAVLMMCFGALMMAVAPTYDQLGGADGHGYLAAWIVAAARLIQGLSVGGQYGAAATYMSEVAPKGRRGFWSSFQYVTLIGGQLLAGIVLMVLLLYFNEGQMKAGAWRIAFWIGAALAIVVFFLQTFIHESHSFKAIKEKSKMDPRHGGLVVLALSVTMVSFILTLGGHSIPSMVTSLPEGTKGFALLMFKHGVTITLLLISAAVLVWPMAKRFPKPTFAIMGLTIGGTSGFYAYSTYMLKFLQASHAGADPHFTKQIANNINLWYLTIFMVAQPLMGLLSDKFGRKNMLLLAFGGGALAAYPVFSAISTNGNFWTAIALCSIPLLILSAYTSISAIVKAELFPAHVRALGVALPYAIANAAAGALVEPLALYWKTQGQEATFY